MCLVIGEDALVSGIDGIAIGEDAVATGNESIAIGSGAGNVQQMIVLQILLIPLLTRSG